MNKILKIIYKYQDKRYAEFQCNLIPTVDKNFIIGVRTGDLRKIAKFLLAVLDNDNVDDKSLCECNFDIKKKDVSKFLMSLPHKYFDENQLHSFIISYFKDFNSCISHINTFLPFVDNWATCDQLSPICFKKNKDKILPHIKKWIKSKHSYTIRFGIECLMKYFLDSDFSKTYLEMVAGINYKEKGKYSVDIDPDKYYVEMMIAWFFATALAKQYDETLPFIKNKKLNAWTHNKAIQKAIESYRVSDAHKVELRKYKNTTH